jgi:hypothetical protein
MNFKVILSIFIIIIVVISLYYIIYPRVENFIPTINTYVCNLISNNDYINKSETEIRKLNDELLVLLDYTLDNNNKNELIDLILQAKDIIDIYDEYKDKDMDNCDVSNRFIYNIIDFKIKYKSVTTKDQRPIMSSNVQNVLKDQRPIMSSNVQNVLNGPIMSSNVQNVLNGPIMSSNVLKDQRPIMSSNVQNVLNEQNMSSNVQNVQNVQNMSSNVQNVQNVQNMSSKYPIQSSRRQIIGLSRDKFKEFIESLSPEQNQMLKSNAALQPRFK